MRESKLQVAREYILRRIDSGEFCGGKKLPSAREIAGTIQVSYPIVQAALNTLVSEGMVATSNVTSHGTFVRHDWAQRILPGNFLAFRPVWKNLFYSHIREQVPELIEVSNFHFGAFEIRVTYDAVVFQDDYLDLSEFLNAEYPDQSDFFQTRINQFRNRDGKLYALPLIFSPWVFCCDEKLFAQAGMPLPSHCWTWQDFLQLLEELCRKLPTEQVLHRGGDVMHWLLYFINAGGTVLDGGQVHFNSLESLKALRNIRKLYQHFPCRNDSNHWPEPCALRLCTRQDYYSLQLNGMLVPMPRLSNENSRMIMAADLLCVRKTVNNFALIRKMIRELLSPELQTGLARLRYGIPIRKSSALLHFDEADTQDSLFISEMTKIVNVPHYAYPVMNEFLQNAVGTFLTGTEREEIFAGEISGVLNGLLTYLRRKKNVNNTCY